jgi:hypothetical protein
MPAHSPPDGRYEVQPVLDGDGWVMVVALFATFPAPSHVAAMFRPEHRDMAQEMADRLNVRALAKES